MTSCPRRRDEFVDTGGGNVPVSDDGRVVAPRFRRTGRGHRVGLAWVLFGRFEADVLDDKELDSMILMPTVVVACGLCLTALFLLGYNTLA